MTVGDTVPPPLAGAVTLEEAGVAGAGVDEAGEAGVRLDEGGAVDVPPGGGSVVLDALQPAAHPASATQEAMRVRSAQRAMNLKIRAQA